MTNDPSEPLLRRVDDGVCWLTLNRPEAANAITPAQRDDLIAHLHAVSGDLNIRAAVITANGKHFCTGADLRVDRPGAEDRPEGSPERPTLTVSRNIQTGAQRLIGAILDCDKPVIAAVNGTAAGIGAHIAFACDLVIAAEGSRFIEVFVRRGIVPDGGGAWLLTRTLGLQKAKELVFFGDDLAAADAERLGLVNRIVPGDCLLAEAGVWATRLANGPTIAIGLAKQLLNRAGESDRATAFREEALAQEVAMSSQDAQEGVRSFVERRPTAFRGW